MIKLFLFQKNSFLSNKINQNQNIFIKNIWKDKQNKSPDQKYFYTSSRISHLMNRASQLNDTERLALINLRQLSEIPWRNEDQGRQGTIQHTNQSVQLPLGPKHLHYEKNSINNFRRPHTIQYKSILPNGNRVNLRKYHVKSPYTSLNFYQPLGKSFNTFDNRSRLNDQIQQIANKIKQEERRTTPANKTLLGEKSLYKTNLAKKSLVYRQFKNYLVQTFKVDGKPVNIDRNQYYIETPGLTTKKSIYSLKNKHPSQFQRINKTENLLKKVHRYDMEQFSQAPKIKTKFKSQSHHTSLKCSFLGNSSQLRQSKNSCRQTKGKLWFGRPPFQILSKQQD